MDDREATVAVETVRQAVEAGQAVSRFRHFKVRQAANHREEAYWSRLRSTASALWPSLARHDRKLPTSPTGAGSKAAISLGEIRKSLSIVLWIGL
ncbi:MAG: hypothetical protein K0S58_1540 [Nitrospira sp.]|jgi:hypothetical protein|nr:hypothetical protein [Nitrospira sp.]